MFSRARSVIVGLTSLAIVGGALAVVPPVANAEVPNAVGDVIINEVYGGGGNSGAFYTNDFIELYNTTGSPINLSTWSVQYKSATGTTWQATNLTGSIAANGYYLIQQAAGTGGTAGLPTPIVSGSIPMSGTAGVVALVNNQTQLTCPDAPACTSVLGLAQVRDLVGFGTANTFAGTGPTGAPSNTTSASRAATPVNTWNNSADYSVIGAPSPGTAEPAPPEDIGLVPISQVQGTGATSPHVGDLATVQGVVTAKYATGGIAGFYIQTEDTGGDPIAGRTASDAIFVYAPSIVATSTAVVGDLVEAKGLVSEFSGLTEITVTAAANLTDLGVSATPPVATTGTWAMDDVARETIESMLYTPSDDFTVSNTFNTNQFGEVGLAVGDTPLRTPTDAATPLSPEALAVAADNAERRVALDDGATTNFIGAGNGALTPPYISLTPGLRVGDSVDILTDVIVDYRNNAWKFQPLAPVTDANDDAFATFTPTADSARATEPDADALGDGAMKVASFNVLNYFTTLGANVAGCTSFNDRAGNGITVNNCPGNGPRGAWDAASLTRQQAKIVEAINGLDADVVGLMEIENSLVVSGTADAALTTLVNALNTDAGVPGLWAFVPSSAQLPLASEMDVISNAIIYKPATVSRVGASLALGTESGIGEAFDNAREPLGQVFKPAGGGDPFFVAVNHFKSKGSGSGPDADQGDGQGASNFSRVRQAEALDVWVDGVKTSAAVDDVFLIGDFNSYTFEDPLDLLYDEGYTDINEEHGNEKQSYNFSGENGSLDHILVNAGALERITGSDIWNINAPESIALEYSRYNYHGTLFYAADAYRSSDHDPVIAAFTPLDPAPADTTDITLVSINDFHGRIDANTVKWAGTVAQVVASANGADVAITAAGDLVGASLFASAVAQDQPTIDVMNAIGLDASAVGNHEFDQGWDDLHDRILGGDPENPSNAQWKYLGANVYAAGTEDPVLPEYHIMNVEGIDVGVIGVVTEETPSLVSPAGIVDLDFGDPVEAVNRVAAQLSDGNAANGEADVLVATFHDGAPSGAQTLDQNIAASAVFADIVNSVSADVDVLFNGHTHQAYAYDGPIPGQPGEFRPVLQTGNYGDFVGKVVLTVDATGDVVSYTRENVARSTVADTALIAEYPSLAQVKTIVDAALLAAAEVGNEPKGLVTNDITTAYTNGTFGPTGYQAARINGNRDQRNAESALGGLVANALLDTLEPLGTDLPSDVATIGVVNPGGLRNELFYPTSMPLNEGDGVVTYAEANAVLPFVNNLWTTHLTGAQVKTMLEQQWQRDAGNAIPTRAYQHLGLSDNVSYTFDPALPEGSRITSITIDGVPIDPAATYKIATFSFLVAGGDNFRIFTQGTAAQDSGLVDRDAWIAYLEDRSDPPGIAPDYERRSTSVSPAPTTVEQGAQLQTTLSYLDMTSLGTPANTSVDVAIGAVSLGSANVTFAPAASGNAAPVGGLSGTATIDLTVPASVPAGAATVTFTVQPSGKVISLPITVTAAPTTTDITLVSINDFHGRIDANTVKWAGTVAQVVASAGGDDVLITGAGDLVGASLFASAVAQDQPTIDVMNAIGLDASAVGNHEFDQGWDDLHDRIIPEADWDYLGANVYAAGTEDPVLPEYYIQEINGIEIGVIGVVTEETPSLVSPAGIVDLDFGDPVEAVNRVADELTDGDPLNGEADVIVATFHEGAPAGAQTLEQNMAASAVFADIVNGVSADVDVLFNGHTHQAYAYDGPIPGQAGEFRPVLQTGSYGDFVGKVVLTVDLASKDVVSYTRTNVPRTTIDDATLISTYPALQQVKTIVDTALANAAAAGNVPVGQISTDISTAYTNGTFGPTGYQATRNNTNRDQRNAESALGGLVANALLDTLEPLGTDLPTDVATIGVVNPGGLRNELFYPTSMPLNEGDGVVTYAEANAVLPFVNNLWTTHLTGAQVKTMLEQQWQRDGSNNIPTRAYQHLGLSDNVSYTFDPALPEGSRITSITIDGVPIDPAATYKIATFSFLVAGGDNFRIFTQGTAAQDSGLVDRDAWIAYLQDRNTPPGIAPDYERRSAAVSPAPTTVAQGGQLQTTLSYLSMTSLGTPATTSVDVAIGGVSLGSVPVTFTPAASGNAAPVGGISGTAAVNLTVPASVPTGATTVTFTVQPSGKVISIPITVTGDAGPVEPTDSLTPLTPSRILDTRTGGVTGDHLFEGGGIRAPGSTLELQVTGRGGIPADAVGAVLNITATDGTGVGYATVFPCGQPRPEASSLNFTAGVPSPNAVVAAIGTDGKVCLYVAESSVHLIADVNGYVAADSGYLPLNPARLADSRNGASTTDGQFLGGGPRGAGTVWEITVAGRGGVPADATTAALNVTTTGASDTGYITAWPCDVPQPLASSVNFTAGANIPNSVVSKLSATGTVCLYVGEASTHLVVDVNGAFLAGSSYGALVPARLLDTRNAPTVDGLFRNGGARQPGQVLELTVAGRGGVPADAVGVMLNLTATDASGTGYVTGWPCGGTQPNVSSLNYLAATPRANSSFVALSPTGTVCLVVMESATELIADVTGYV